MGSTPHAHGVAFRVRAPHAQRVSVIGSFDDFGGTRHPMQAEEDGNWCPGSQPTVVHLNRYRYTRPIPHSRHGVHPRPIDDAYQRDASYRLLLGPQIPAAEFEDVFGNWAGRFEIRQPYTEPTLTAGTTTTPRRPRERPTPPPRNS
jgi:hypothetical protein